MAKFCDWLEILRSLRDKMEIIFNEKEAAGFLKVSPATLRRLRMNRQVPYVPGKPVRYMQTSLVGWLQAKELPVVRASEDKRKGVKPYAALDAMSLMLAI